MTFLPGLINSGLDDKLRNNLDENLLSRLALARIIQVNKNNYEIYTGIHFISAELTGRFLYAAVSPLEFPAVGDWVYVQVYDNNTLAIIHELVPRKSLLKRKTAGKKIDYQLIAANIDTAVIVQALDSNFNISRLERYLVIAAEGNITPMLLLSKSDLSNEAETANKKSRVEKLFPELKVITFSNLNEADTESLTKIFLPARTYCLLGSSGVGKTTLINRLLNSEALKTGAVREKDGRGKHTTTNRELIFLGNGAMIIDNPGMRELGMLGGESGLSTTFDELGELAINCRYQDCTHTVEKGCAVLEAVEDGSFSKERYLNYIKLYKEMRYNELSYIEKRQKDKQFGKMVNKALKIKGDKRQGK